MVQKAAKGRGSPEDVARAIADGHAAAVEFPQMSIPEDAPVGIIAQRMVEGRFDKAFLVGKSSASPAWRSTFRRSPGRLHLSSLSTDIGAPN